jgi:hypothetical protein
MEIWKDIINYEGKYQVSDSGRVRNKVTLQILTPSERNGYFRIGLYTNTIKRNKAFSVHRLVAESFLGYKTQEFEVNHKNGNKLDNRLSNLEWVTPSENVKHSYITNLRKKGSKLIGAKLNEEVVKLIKAEIFSNSERLLAKKYNVSRITIRNIKSGRCWSHVEI